MVRTDIPIALALAVALTAGCGKTEPSHDDPGDNADDQNGQCAPADCNRTQATATGCFCDPGCVAAGDCCANRAAVCDGDAGTDPDGGVKACTGEAAYRLTMDLRWQQTPPLVPSMTSPGFPAGAEHIARIAGGVHGPADTGPWSWQVGQPASPGVEATAEVNGFQTFLAELTASGVQTFQSQDDFVTTLELAPTQLFTMSSLIRVAADRPMVTMMAMLAPSPDWFVGLSRESLCIDGDWVASKTFPLSIFDAGTEAHLVPGTTQFAAPQFNLSGAPISGGTIQLFQDSDQNQAGPLAQSIASRFNAQQSEVSWTFTRVVDE